MVELDRAKLYSYACGFNASVERREERLHAEDMQNAVFDKKLAQEEVWIRQGIKARRTRNIGRVRELMKMREERAAAGKEWVRPRSTCRRRKSRASWWRR